MIVTATAPVAIVVTDEQFRRRTEIQSLGAYAVFLMATYTNKHNRCILALGAVPPAPQPQPLSADHATGTR